MSLARSLAWRGLKAVINKSPKPLPTWRICSPKPPSWASTLRQRFRSSSVTGAPLIRKRRWRGNDSAGAVAGVVGLIRSQSAMPPRMPVSIKVWLHRLLHRLPEAVPGALLLLDLVAHGVKPFVVQRGIAGDQLGEQALPQAEDALEIASAWPVRGSLNDGPAAKRRIRSATKARCQKSTSASCGATSAEVAKPL